MIRIVNLFALITLIVSLLSCSAEQEPIEFGKEDCNYCKMKIMDKKYGAEIVTKKGKIFKFDDVNCMVRYIKDNSIEQNTLALKLIIDYANPTKLIDINKAYFVRSELINSPMGSYIAAFGTKESQLQQNSKWNGELWEWKKIWQTFN